jgi:hypothetical protein
MSILKNTSPVPQTVGQQVVAPGARSAELDPGEHERRLLQEGLLIDVTPTAGDRDPLEDLSVAELRAQADARGLKVEGTGANGTVKKADLISALHGAGNADTSED